MRLARGYAVFLLVAAALASSGCARTDAAERDDRASEVRRGTLVQKIVLNGEVEARRGVFATVPRNPSWETTLKWIADDGATVRVGDRIAELDNTSVTSTVEQKRIALREAQQQLAQQQARTSAEIEEKTFELERRRIALDNAKVAAAVPDSVLSRREYQDRQLELQRATIEHEKALESLRSAREGAAAERRNFEISITAAQEEIAVAEKAISDMELRAEANGIFVVTEIPWEGRKLLAGDRVWVGFPIGMIPDFATLQIVAQLWDVDDGKVRVGDEVQVTIDAYPQKQFKGKIVSIAPVAQETSRQALRRAFKTVVVLDSVDPQMMRPGFSARVVVERTLARNALLAPRSAIVREKNRGILLLEDGGEREVTVGACDAQQCVVSGVSEGTRVRSRAKAASNA